MLVPAAHCEPTSLSPTVEPRHPRRLLYLGKFFFVISKILQGLAILLSGCDILVLSVFIDLKLKSKYRKGQKGAWRCVHLWFLLLLFNKNMKLNTRKVTCGASTFLVTNL